MRLKVIVAIPKQGRYHPENPAFRKACIRERLAEIKQRRDVFSKELGEFVAAQKLNGQKTAGGDNLHPYVGENPTFRKAYLRYRMDQLKDERQKLVDERDALDARLAATRNVAPSTNAKKRSFA